MTYELTVHPLEMGTDKEATVKVLEEAAVTPTDEIRARLDELGVEYTANDAKHVKETCWPYMGELMAVFAEYDNGTTRFVCDTWCFTPEQAIAATVGAGTCKRVYHPNRITKTCTCSNCGYGASDERWAYCPKCGHKYVHGEVEEMWKRAERKVAE